jgi:hypothetical protein
MIRKQELLVKKGKAFAAWTLYSGDQLVVDTEIPRL